MKPATTVTKVCRILTEIKGQPTLGVSEIARRAGLLPSDAHRLLDALRACGYVRQDSSTRRYGTGPELLELGRTVASGGHPAQGTTFPPGPPRLLKAAYAVSFCIYSSSTFKDSHGGISNCSCSTK